MISKRQQGEFLKEEHEICEKNNNAKSTEEIKKGKKN